MISIVPEGRIYDTNPLLPSLLWSKSCRKKKRFDMSCYLCSINASFLWINYQLHSFVMKKEVCHNVISSAGIFNKELRNYNLNFAVRIFKAFSSSRGQCELSFRQIARKIRPEEYFDDKGIATIRWNNIICHGDNSQGDNGFLSF